VIEADEYDTAFFDKRSKFVHYRPRTAVLNNLEFDHADIFDDLAAIERQFHHLVRTVPASGRVVVNGLEEAWRGCCTMGCWSEVRSFGAAVSDFSAPGRAARISACCTMAARPGRCNGRWAVCTTSSMPWQPSPQPSTWAWPRQRGAALATLREREAPHGGASHRGHVRDARPDGVTVYDDFAHHPTAIRTTLDGLRRTVGGSAHPGGVRTPLQHHETRRHESATALEPGARRPGVLPHVQVWTGTRPTRWHRWVTRAAGTGYGRRLVSRMWPCARPGDHIVVA